MFISYEYVPFAKGTFLSVYSHSHKFWPKFQQEFWPKFQQEFLPKFQNFGSNLNKIFYKILVNLNILPIIFAVVLLSLLQYYNKNPVRNLVSISAILLLKYCYTFSYRLTCFRIY